MDNLESIKFTYKHRKVVDFLAKKYLSKEEYEEIYHQIKLHDFDKMMSYLFYPRETCKIIHRENNAHHLENNKTRTRLDYLEMIFDWESARYTKPDKPLNAYETLEKFYKNEEEHLLPLLKELHLDKENTKPEEDVVRYVSTLNDELDNIKAEFIDIIDYMFNREKNREQKIKKYDFK